MRPPYAPHTYHTVYRPTGHETAEDVQALLIEVRAQIARVNLRKKDLAEEFNIRYTNLTLLVRGLVYADSAFYRGLALRVGVEERFLCQFEGKAGIVPVVKG